MFTILNMKKIHTYKIIMERGRQSQERRQDHRIKGKTIMCFIILYIFNFFEKKKIVGNPILKEI